MKNEYCFLWTKFHNLHVLKRNLPLKQHLICIAFSVRPTTDSCGCSEPMHSWPDRLISRGGPQLGMQDWSPWSVGTDDGPGLGVDIKCGSAFLSGDGGGVEPCFSLGTFHWTQGYKFARIGTLWYPLDTGHFCKVKAKLLTSWSISVLFIASVAFKTWSMFCDVVGAILGGGPDLLGAVCCTFVLPAGVS